MTLKRLLPAGLLLLLLTLVPGEMLGAKPLYERMKEAVEEETGHADDIDPTIVDFIRNIFKEEWDPANKDLELMLQGKGEEACGNADSEKKYKNRISCLDLTSRVEALGQYEQNIRMLGRTLQATATSYELPVSDLPGRTLTLSADLRAIVNIWSAGTGSIKSKAKNPQIRTYSPAKDELDNTYRSLFTDIGEALETMKDEEQVGAVWRYQYGVRFVRGERAPTFPAPYEDTQSGPGTERQYLFKHFDDLEEKLNALWRQIQTTPFTPALDPPLTSKESVYYTFPKEFIDETLPDNIIVWMRYDGDATNNRPFSDVGLQWQVPIEPVHPSLIKDAENEADRTAIRGGDYPPEPVIPENRVPRLLEGRGLCSSPVAAHGYLCRPFEAVSPEDRCPITEEQAESDSIQLIYCERAPDGTEGTWCCNPDSNSCSAMLNATQCVQDGGIPSSGAQGCAANGCRVPEDEPAFCCLPGADKMCVKTLNSALCEQRGGTASTDAEGCMTNGCNAFDPNSQRITTAGSDVCREIKWKTEPFDPQKHCKVQFSCASDCEDPVKDGDGNIVACAENMTAGAQATYRVFHAMVHAYQGCTMEPGKNPYEEIPADASGLERSEIQGRNNALFCEREGEAYEAMCGMMERDGVFLDDTGNRLTSVDGVPFTAETCAEAWTYFAAEEKGYKGCSTSRTYSLAFMNDLRRMAERNPKDLPNTCEDAINPLKMDVRLQQFKDAIESRDDICKPGEVNQYKNRIGNNACYIGQCVEMSVELHRIAGGADPFVVQGEVAPWDDPQTGTPLGNALMNPPVSQGRLPQYMPQRFMLELETALCQLQGLPPLTPPILCAVDARRQLELTRVIGAQTALGIATQNNESALSAADLLALSQGIGTRLGTEMYADYVRESNKSFAGIIDMASTLLEELEKIDFPTQMCPLEPGLPPPVSI